MTGTVAFLFPGQGVGVPWAGRALAERFPEVRDPIDAASAAVGLDLFQALGRASPHLARTAVLQPLMTAVCVGTAAVLGAHGLRASFVAGHSLGELAAWSVAGHATAGDAVRVAAQRGRLMADAAARRPGTMLAVGDTEEGELEAVLSGARRHGALALAAHNAPRDWAVSGERPALAAVARALPSTWLDAEGAWHSSAMGVVSEVYLAALRGVQRGTAPPAGRPSFVTNRTGAVAQDVERLPELQAEQLVRPIRWAESMATLRAAGVTDFVTVGPGKVLRAFVRKNLGAAPRVHAAERVSDLERALEALAP